MSKKEINTKDYVTVATLSKINPNENLGVSQDYKRELYEKSADINNREAFKEQQFGGKKTIKDPVSGELLHRNTAAAKRKYGKLNWTKHATHADHIVSLEQAHERHKWNTLISDDDLREIVNRRSNLMLTSVKTNTSKRSLSNRAYVKKHPELSDDAKKVLVGVEKESLLKMDIAAAGKTAKNAGREILSGAKEAAIVASIVSTIDNLCRVGVGEKEIKEAVKDIALTTGKAAAVGGATQLAATVLQTTGNIVPIGCVVTAGLAAGESAIRYINGEITGEQFREEVDEKGKMLVIGAVTSTAVSAAVSSGLVSAGMLTAAGAATATSITALGTIGAAAIVALPAAAALVASAIAVMAFQYVNKVLRSIKEVGKEAKRVSAIANAALREMERQRNELKTLINNHFKEWDERFDEGFKQLFDAAPCSDANGVANGLDTILSAFGQSVRFKTAKEFDDFFMAGDAVLEF